MTEFTHQPREEHTYLLAVSTTFEDRDIDRVAAYLITLFKKQAGINHRLGFLRPISPAHISGAASTSSYCRASAKQYL